MLCVADLCQAESKTTHVRVQQHNGSPCKHVWVSAVLYEYLGTVNLAEKFFGQLWVYTFMLNIHEDAHKAII